MTTVTRYLGFTDGIQRLVWSGPGGTITAHLWGGGGGFGGGDGGRIGGNGTGGGYATTVFTVVEGDVIDVAVGEQGENGQGYRSGAAGGSAGASYGGEIFNTRTGPVLPAVYPQTNSSWGSFLNTYGVWESYAGASSFQRTYPVNFPISGNYSFTLSVDNYATVSLDGAVILSVTGSSSTNYQRTFQATVFVNAGTHSVSIDAVNTGGPGGVAVTIGATNGYSGGAGGRAGYSGSSGGGGGGGGATVILRNSVLLAVAAGGGGGGGAGVNSNGQNAPGPRGQATAGTFSGQNGQDKAGDGGGGGGGGGGYQGGNGGEVSGGDNGAYAGCYGLSSAPGENPSGILPGGAGSVYYKNGIAVGGSASGPATGGYAAIVIETFGTNIHDGNDFVPVRNLFIRQQDSWKEITGIWVKEQGIWKNVVGSTAPPFSRLPNTIGVSSRPWV